MNGPNERQTSISKKTFISSFLILLMLLILAGIMTMAIPTGSYERRVVGEKVIIDVESFSYTNLPPYPVWKWFTAPLEVLGSSEGLVVIVIILFILITGGSINVLNECDVIKFIVTRIVDRYRNKRYRLLALMVLMFMIIGAVVGIFEEAILLVPAIIPLAYSFGWDSLTGLGMSLLAIAFGFSSAITNPFTIGVAQRIAEVPLFSGMGLRVLVFVSIYTTLCLFLINHAKKIEKNPEASPVFEEDEKAREKLGKADYALLSEDKGLDRAVKWFSCVMLMMLLVVLGTSLVKGLSDYSFPIVGLLFMVGGIGSGLLAGKGGGELARIFLQGSLGIAPGILLILMAAGVKHIIATGGVMDTIIFNAAGVISEMSPMAAVGMVYMLILAFNFFIGSASAKAFILMPIIAPLADILGIKRQMAVLAFQFGDGFSNVLYPTNAVLLICLGFTVVSYPKWMRWTLKLQLIVFAITLAFLVLGLLIGYGPV